MWFFSYFLDFWSFWQENRPDVLFGPAMTHFVLLYLKEKKQVFEAGRERERERNKVLPQCIRKRQNGNQIMSYFISKHYYSIWKGWENFFLVFWRPLDLRWNVVPIHIIIFWDKCRKDLAVEAPLISSGFEAIFRSALCCQKTFFGEGTGLFLVALDAI